MNTLQTQDVQKLREQYDDFILLNVLPQDKFNQEHIPGSLNIPLDSPDFLSKVEKAVGGNKQKTIVVYCANQNCDLSPKAAKKLGEAGFTKVYDYEEGMQG